MKQFQMAKEAFASINNICTYLVLRNFEQFYEDLLMEGHNDVDVLCKSHRDRRKMVKALGAVPRLTKDNGTHYRFLCQGKWIDLDIRCVGDGYYDSRWQKEMLRRRVYDARGFYRMDEENYFYSLLYHGLYQKDSLSDEYAGRLRQMQRSLKKDLRVTEQTVSGMEKQLTDFMRQRNYCYTKTRDHYITLHFPEDRTSVPIKCSWKIRMFHLSQMVLGYADGKRTTCLRIFKSIRNRVAEILYQLFRLPVNLYFNFRLLPVSQAVKLPFFIGYGVSVKEIHRGNVVLLSDHIYRSMISIGRGGSPGIQVLGRGAVSFAPGARIVFGGTAQFHAGSRLFLGDRADVVIGDGFSANRNFLLYYDSKLSIGQECMFGWNVQILDVAAHRVFYGGEEKIRTCEIRIKDHVWIGAEVKLTRSTTIGRHSIVAYGSTMTGGTFGEGLLLGGYPAHVIREYVDWEK